MNSDNAIQTVKRRMLEMGYSENEYTLSFPETIVAASTVSRISDPSDIFFLSNVYMGAVAALNGKIEGEDNAVMINTKLANRNYSMVQIFRGVIDIYNDSAAANLYVEFIRASPLIFKEVCN